jgi:hypothetical protein
LLFEQKSGVMPFYCFNRTFGGDLKKKELNQTVKPITILGDPEGNRAERRMAKKLSRNKGGKERLSDLGPQTGLRGKL